MSYGIDFELKCNVKSEDVQKEITRFINYKMDHINEEIKKIWIINFDFDNGLKYSEHNLSEVLKWFQWKVVYWEEYNIIGFVTGSNVPSDYKHIYFQNSVDTDYERSAFPDDSIFKEIYDEVESLPDAEVYSDSDNRNEIEYHRRMLAYDKIYERLNLCSVLWGGTDMIQYYVSPCDIYDKRHNILKLIYEKYLETYVLPYSEKGDGTNGAESSK